ncbi:hypothetical protein RRG08_060991 [Elysia crispata]|uniref:Uncharacterized protein n=1 Tax=Elysia crispata TaxID=231223 RepID=A0AAE1AVW9_9GAST|nr:hypothetical protein RRG08_060991 [Elysia crispata]
MDKSLKSVTIQGWLHWKRAFKMSPFKGLWTNLFLTIQLSEESMTGIERKSLRTTTVEVDLTCLGMTWRQRQSESAQITGCDQTQISATNSTDGVMPLLLVFWS